MTRRVLTALVPIAITLLANAVGAALLASVRDELPTQIAIHWGTRGDADGFATCAGVMAMGWLLPMGTIIPIALLGLAIRQGAALAGVAAGTGVFMAGILFGPAYAQRGLADGEVARLTNWTFVWPTVLGIAVGIAVGLVLRSRPERGLAEPLPSDALRTDVPETAAIAWSGTLRPARGGQIFLIVVILATAAFGIVMWITSGIWFVTLLAALMTLLIPLMNARVDIDRRGVRVSALGLGRWTPLSDITVGRVTQVNCLGDYGGWGYRAGFDGSWGWVSSNGEALRIERPGTADLVVTIDGAAEAAAVLNTLISRVRV